MTEQSKRFANRDEPFPILSFSDSEDQGQKRDHGDHTSGSLDDYQSSDLPIHQVGHLKIPKRDKMTGAAAWSKEDTGEEGREADGTEGGKRSWRSWSGSSGGIQDQLYKL